MMTELGDLSSRTSVMVVFWTMHARGGKLPLIEKVRDKALEERA